MMELEQLKADWQQQHSIVFHRNSLDINEGNTNMEKLAIAMSSLDKEIRYRTIFGVLSFTLIILSTLALAYFLYVLNMPVLAISGLFTFVLCLIFALIILILVQQQNTNSDKTLSIEASLIQKLQKIKAESRFYQTIVWWLLAPMSIGMIMILIATKASLLAASFEMVVFGLCFYWAHQNNQRHIADNLKPLEDEIGKGIDSLS